MSTKHIHYNSQHNPFKKPSFAKTAVSSLKMSQLEIFLWLTQAPNTSMQISRNIGATITASRKLAYDNVLNFFTKRPFFSPKKIIDLNLYISMN